VLPAEAFGSVPQISNVELSPDGTMLAWSEVIAGGSRVVMFDLGTRKNKHEVPVMPPVKLRSLTWADNETLLLTASNVAAFGTGRADNYEVYRTYAVDVAGGNARMLLMEGGDRSLVTGAALLAWRTSKPKTVVMSTWDYAQTHARVQTGSRLAGGRKDSGWVSQVFEVDTRTGKGTRVAIGTQFTDDWIVNKDGKPVARSEWIPESEIYSIAASSGGGGWKQLLRQEHRGTRVMYGLTRDETAIIISDTNPDGRQILRTLPLDGSEGKVLLEDAAADVSHVRYDRITRTPVSAVLGGLEQPERWLDTEAERQVRKVSGAFKGKRVWVYGRSEDAKRVLAVVEGPSSPPIYYFVDYTAGTADIVGEAYPKLIDAKLGEVRAIHYAARDGEKVPAYLTLPPGSEASKLPLILLPHGGPEARDENSFDWWAQFLAARGYAVLQPQFRGSTGFGKPWRQAGYRQWGGLMQDDLTDGVKALVEQGIADPERICIVGASYGGYAALAGAAFTPDMFRCAVSINGVSDLPRMLGYERQHSGEESDALAYWREHIGPSTDKQVIAKSPLRSAAQIKIPVLLMHAADDTVVPVSQSEAMSRELRELRKKVSFVRLAGEDHWLSQTATRVQMLKELEKFLDANMGKEP
jgi:dipeptidyl aminopeptidase/acylaminoacyl peptidase